MERDLVQRVLERLRILRVALDEPAHDFADDVVALAVEPEDRRVVGLGHVGTQPRKSHRALEELRHHTASK